MEETPRERAQLRVAFVMSAIREAIDSDPEVSRAEAAKAAGIPISTFYRWLKDPPEKMDAAALAAVADYLHKKHGHANFEALWRLATAAIE